MKSWGKWLHAFTRPLIHAYLRWHKKPRSRVWLTNAEDEVLLVKSWYSHQHWSLPGGGVKRGETERQAARRELEEETGIRLPEESLREHIRLPVENGLFTAVVFVANVSGEPLPVLARGRSLEIIDRMWVHPNELPDNTSPLIRTVSESLMLAGHR